MPNDSIFLSPTRTSSFPSPMKQPAVPVSEGVCSPFFKCNQSAVSADTLIESVEYPTSPFEKCQKLNRNDAMQEDTDDVDEDTEVDILNSEEDDPKASMMDDEEEEDEDEDDGDEDIMENTSTKPTKVATIERVSYPTEHLDRLVRETLNNPYVLDSSEIVVVHKNGRDWISQVGRRGYRDITCHKCKGRRALVLLCGDVCSDVNDCATKICAQCLYAHFGENFADVLLLKDWQCPICRELCTCPTCCRRREKHGIEFGDASDIPVKREKTLRASYSPSSGSKSSISRSRFCMSDGNLSMTFVDTIMARKIGLNGHASYLVKWSDYEIPTWERPASFTSKTHIHRFKSTPKITLRFRSSKSNMKNNSKAKKKSTKNTKKRTHLRTSDYDIGNIQFDAIFSPKPRLPPKVRTSVIKVPSYRIVEDYDMDMEDLVKQLAECPSNNVDSSDEDTSDEAYLLRHNAMEKVFPTYDLETMEKKEDLEKQKKSNKPKKSVKDHCESADSSVTSSPCTLSPSSDELKEPDTTTPSNCSVFFAA